MNSTTTIIIAVLSSGVIAAIVSAVMQKRNEKEQRIFNAKLKAYEEFASHLEGKFVSLTRNGKDLNLNTLMEISARCLLVANEELNSELKSFLSFVSQIYERCCSSDYDADKESQMFTDLWNRADKVELLMRKDLGF